MKPIYPIIEIDEELQQLARLQWEIFITLIGPDAVVTAKVHLMKRKGKSINQIARILKITKSQVETRLKRSNTIIFPSLRNS